MKSAFLIAFVSMFAGGAGAHGEASGKLRIYWSKSFGETPALAVMRLVKVCAESPLNGLFYVFDGVEDLQFANPAPGITSAEGTCVYKPSPMPHF